MEEFHFTDLRSDMKKKKEISNSDKKKIRNALPFTAHSSTSQLNIFDKKNYIHFSKNAKSCSQFLFSYPTQAAHLPFPFILNVTLTKSCIAPTVPASTLSVC